MKKSVPENMIYLLKVLWRHGRKTFVTMWLHILIAAIVPFIAVLIPSVIISQLMHHSDMISFMKVSGILLLCYGLLQGSVSYLNDYNAFAFIGLRTKQFVRKIYLKRAHMDLMVLEDSENKKLLEDAISAIESNTEGVEGMYHDFITFMTAFLGLILYVITSGGLSVWLVLGLLVLVVIQYMCFVKARNYEDSHRNELNAYLIQARYLNQIAYNTSAGKDIRLFQLQDWIDYKFRSVNKMIAHIKAKDYGAYMLVDTLSIVLDFIRDIACYGFLIFQLMHGMAIDEFVFYLGIISGFSIWFKQAGEAYSKLSSKNMLVNRMMKALQIKNVLHHGDGENIKGKDITITFDHVRFHYPNQERFILDDVSFTLHPHEKLALVGVNGAGKSTIVKLILGFYLPSEGSVRINGIDTRNLNVDDIYNYVTGIFQDSVMMSYTIAENVSMNDASLTDMEKVRECLKHTGIWDKICTLSQQENTYIGKDIESNGIQLSGGEMQKLFMARALYRRFHCLLLDEPTAALDALAEKEMYESYQKLTEGKSSLFISHRLSSTRFCDHILVLEQGKIVEEGSHEVLMALQGIYTHMFHVQSKYYEEGGEGHEILAGN